MKMDVPYLTNSFDSAVPSNISTVTTPTRSDGQVSTLQVAQILESFRGGVTELALSPVTDSGTPHDTPESRKSRADFWRTVIGGNDGVCVLQAPEKRETGVESSKGDRKKGAKRFACSICGLRFSQRGGVVSHVRSVHQRLRPFACDFRGCPSTFGHRGDVTRHVRSVHEGARPFKCDICSTRFARKSVLVRHQRHVHKLAEARCAK